ncbi:MAG: hypothetical protein D6790_00780 [Caldilineae bacterium]|nr:MAG: hypothetical protein D6790_00780 [Caldilineae bacterium]
MQSINKIIDSINALGANKGSFTVNEGHLTYDVTFDDNVAEIILFNKDEKTSKVIHISRDGSGHFGFKAYPYIADTEIVELLMMINNSQLEALKRIAPIIQEHALPMWKAIREGNDDLEVHVAGVVPPFIVEVDWKDSDKVLVSQDEWYFYWDELDFGDVMLPSYHTITHEIINKDNPLIVSLDYDVCFGLLNAIAYYDKHIKGKLPKHSWLHVKLRHVKALFYPDKTISLATSEWMTEPMNTNWLIKQFEAIVS